MTVGMAGDRPSTASSVKLSDVVLKRRRRLRVLPGRGAANPQRCSPVRAEGA